MEEVVKKVGNRYKIQKTCSECQNDFFVRRAWCEKQKFCSQKCSAISRARESTQEVSCAYCNKVFRKALTRLNTKSGLHFCSRVHKDLAQRIGGIKEIQPSHYGTVNTNYREVAFRNNKAECVRCGYDKYTNVLVVHHIDRDRTNNVLENLEILCPNCHAEEHYKAEDGVWTKSRNGGI